MKSLSLNRGGLYIDSPNWLKNKKTAIIPKNINEKMSTCHNNPENHQQSK